MAETQDQTEDGSDRRTPGVHTAPLGSENPAISGAHRTIGATCQTHHGCKGFCNLRLTKLSGKILFDPHVTGCCVISLDESEAKAVRDTLAEWLG